MIVLKMEKYKDGNQKPIELQINDRKYTKNLFKELEQHINDKIRVEYYQDNKLINQKNHIIKRVFQNKEGIPSLELD